MVVYAPGTEETDQKKQNMAIQAAAGAIATNTTNIATNTATLAAIAASPITASLGANVALNNIASYFDGPSIAQGSTGKWVAMGQVTVAGGAAGDDVYAKLWDGTNVVATLATSIPANGYKVTLSLSGIFSSPPGNIRISCRNAVSTTGNILFNSSGLSKDSTITAFRIA